MVHLRLPDPHQSWASTLASGSERCALEVRWTFLEGLLQTLLKEVRQESHRQSPQRRQPAAGSGGLESPMGGIIEFPKGQGSNQVKWFEKLPGARNPEVILNSASLA